MIRVRGHRMTTYRECRPTHVLVSSWDEEMKELPMIHGVSDPHFMRCEWYMNHKSPESKGAESLVCLRSVRDADLAGVPSVAIVDP